VARRAYNFVDLTGQIFERLTVLERSESDKHGNIYWKCVCKHESHDDKIIFVRGTHLKKGITKSCGCYSADKTKERATKHGMSDKNIYRVYTQMIQRCENTKNAKYSEYGGRGIKVCKVCIPNFETYYEQISNLPNAFADGHTIDRDDNNGIYCFCVNNMRWVTRVTQQRNQRVRKDNTSGTRGVTFDKDSNLWYVMISVNNKIKFIGRFSDKEEAVSARKQAEIDYWHNGKDVNEISNISRHNKTGFKGIYKNKHSYTASIGLNYKSIHLGSFGTIEEAIEAREQAKMLYLNQRTKSANP